MPLSRFDRETRIGLREWKTVRYWCARFGVPADRLRAAVEKVGALAADVEQELRASGLNTKSFLPTTRAAAFHRRWEKLGERLQRVRPRTGRAL